MTEEMNPEIRLFTPEDKEIVMNILLRHVPRWFAFDELKDYSVYLDTGLEEYFVAEYKGEIVGAGGINIDKNTNIGKLSWDMVDPDYMGKGVGAFMVAYRISRLFTHYKVSGIRVRTSGQAFGFYERCGFRVIRTVKDYWAEGFDLVEMEYVKS